MSNLIPIIAPILLMNQIVNEARKEDAKYPGLAWERIEQGIYKYKSWILIYLPDTLMLCKSHDETSPLEKIGNFLRLKEVEKTIIKEEKHG